MISENELRIIHNYVLDIAKLFHTICQTNNIQYYMLGGSMLGAIRHKGFIPWDDDMDFGVARQDFERLNAILSNNLPKHIRLVSNKNTENFYGGFIKLEDTRTLIKENSSEYDFGVNIDIFPLDKTDNDFSILSKNKRINTLYKIHCYRFYKLANYSLPKRLISKTLHLLHFPKNKFQILNIIEKKLLTNKGDYIANHYGAWGMKETVKASVMGMPTLYSFENEQFYGVENAKSYLEALYGDFMTLPKEDKRQTHIKELIIK